MRKISLNGEWIVREFPNGEWFDGEVPGGIYSDLLEAGQIPDPFYADNELDVQWVGKSDWEYRRTVELNDEFLDHDRLLLACNGIDTVATVHVNGREVGQSVNMHTGYEFDVADALRSGENAIVVRFRSPVEYGIDRQADHPYEVPSLRYPVDQPGRAFIRKAQCHYGWDWGPCLPTAGIYRDISLIAYSQPRITYTKTEQDHTGETIDLTVRTGIDTPTAGDYELTVSLPETDDAVSDTVSLDTGTQEIERTLPVSNVERWWPNNYGDQPLYDLEVTVATRGKDTGEHSISDRIGFRDLELVTDPDGDGSSFYFSINDTPVFAKGANTIPMSPFYAHVTTERYEHVIRSAADANMNMLRVWGGGYYENDEFYDLCDEYGLLVWQDFMFSCSLYPADEQFLSTVEDEVRYQVRRLANHPSLALWCGNNENEEAVRNWFVGHDRHDDHLDDYCKLYTETIGLACREEDPSRTYWPASPSSGPDEDDPNLFGSGDSHYWDVWHNGQSFENYYTTEPRFVSEFGYQSFPSTDSLETVIDEADFNPTSPMMEHHQRNPGGNATILNRMAENFRLPSDFSDFIYLSQIQHGLAMNIAIEHWRRNKPTTMGTLYWQLNVLWPVASWASIEYDGKWKAQQYMARRQYAPVLVSFHPTFGSHSGSKNAQANDESVEKWDDIESQTMWVTSDVSVPLSGRVDIELIHLTDGRVFHAETIDIDVQAQASEQLITVDRGLIPADVNAREVMLRGEYRGAEESYPAVAFFEDFKALDLPETDLTVELDGTDVTVSSETASLFVELDVGGLSGAFSDNFFHLAPGERRTITFESYSDDRSEVIEQRIEDTLELRHLRETY